MNVTEYVGAGIPKDEDAKKSAIKLIKKKQKTVRWTKQERNLCRLFYALKANKAGTYFNSNIFKNVRVRATFQRLAKEIEKYEKDSCTKVDVLLYFGAHLSWFGYEMYPNQLLSNISWNLYQSHERIEHIPTVELTHHDDIMQQFKMLKKLARERKEPERVVLLSLKSSGLFSKEFLQQRGIR